MTFTKGNKLGKGRPPGAKNRSTLLMEERRAIFDARISEVWEDTISKLRPEYIADQFLGKAPDKMDITSKGDKIMTGESEIILLAKEAAAILKEHDTDSPRPSET